MHLAKLGELGLMPWMDDMEIGAGPDEDALPGIYFQQRMLPEEATPVELGSHEYRHIRSLYRQYTSWAREQPGKRPYLYDLLGARQWRIIPEETLLLLDVEPIYAMLDN